MASFLVVAETAGQRAPPGAEEEPSEEASSGKADSRAAAAVAAAAARGECPLDAPRAVRLLDFEQVDYNRREGFNATFFNGRLLELVPKYKGMFV